MNNKNLTLIAYAVIGIGSIPFVWGFILVIPEGEKNDSTSKNTDVEIGQSGNFKLLRDYRSIDAPIGQIFLRFPSNVIFAGDVVNVTAFAVDVHNDVKAIILIVTNPEFNWSGNTGKTMNFDLERARNQTRSLELFFDDNPPFNATESMEFLSPNEELTVKGSYIFKNGTFRILNISGKLFSTYADVDKLQVETNKAIQEQIDETKISNQKQDRTNQLFLGISLIGLALLPILSGVDILLRIHFENVKPS